jgi:hypothetical protein
MPFMLQVIRLVQPESYAPTHKYLVPNLSEF